MPRRMKILVYGILIGIIICVGVACITYFHQESAQLLKVKELVSRYGLIGVFLLTIISGTILPLGSPAIVATGAGFGLPAMPLAAVAALGYTLGVMISYLLGYLGRPLAHKKLRDKTLRTLTNWWDRYGWLLCAVFGFVPGLPLDLLAVLCGLLKVRLPKFLLISFCALFAQFILFAYLGEYLMRLLGI